MKKLRILSFSFQMMFFLILSIIGCKKEINKGFNQKPYDELSPIDAFNSSEDLELYVNSMYDILPDGEGIYYGDDLSDYAARGATPSFLIPGSYNSINAGGWGWKPLRNVNFFLNTGIPLAKKNGVTEKEVNHFTGVARFFRAWFYFDKLKRFGDVPWINKVLQPEDEDLLFKSRDSRVLIVDSILADLNFAINNISVSKDASCSRITKWVALAFKSRVALFEGAFRKYHSELNLQNTSVALFEEAVSSATEIMNSNQYKLHINASNPQLSYRELFIDRSGNPPNDETILSFNASSGLNVLHAASWRFNSASFGSRLSLKKAFVNTYLMIDGSSFTDLTDYNEIPFWDEVKNRDLRLKQTIRLGNYTREETPAPPNFQYTVTGYHPLKFSLDEKFSDASISSDNSLPIIRYAEILLNYAEAKAELGQFNAEDWDKTIKQLRERAGIANASLPTKIDSYLKDEFYPDISDMNLLEIRRERGIELALEGFRFDDIRRWKRGELMNMENLGIYVPAINALYDLNEDGVNDVGFFTEIPSQKEPGVTYIQIDNKQTKLSEGIKGNYIWVSNLNKKWIDYMYYYPIPRQEIVLNPNLVQNGGWD